MRKIALKISKHLTEVICHLYQALFNGVELHNQVRKYTVHD